MDQGRSYYTLVLSLKFTNRLAVPDMVRTLTGEFVGTFVLVFIVGPMAPNDWRDVKVDLVSRRVSGSTEATDEGIDELILKVSVFSDVLHDVETVGNWYDIMFNFVSGGATEGMNDVDYAPGPAVLVCYFFALLTHKQWNKLQHTLIGNMVEGRSLAFDPISARWRWCRWLPDIPAPFERPSRSQGYLVHLGMEGCCGTAGCIRPCEHDGGCTDGTMNVLKETKGVEATPPLPGVVAQSGPLR